MPIQLSLIFGAFLGSIFVVKPTFSNLALVPSLLGFFRRHLRGRGVHDGAENWERQEKRDR